MSITTKDLNDLKENPTKTRRGCGFGLTAYNEPRTASKCVYFIGIMKVKVNGIAKQKEVHIGKYGNNKAAGELTIKTAMEKWLIIKDWSQKNNRPPSDYYKAIEVKNQDVEKTLNDAVNGFLSLKKNGRSEVKPTTYKEYENKLNNQVLTTIDGSTPLKELEWDEGGRQTIMNVIDAISSDGEKFDLARRCRSLLKQTFDYAISKGWMKKGQNPADRLSTERSTHRTNHHPSIEWNEVPNLLNKINLNKCDAQQQTVLATKFLLMTGLRAGALVRLRWDWIDKEKNMFVIPGSTSGLKRVKDKNDQIPHHVPITSEMECVLDRLAKLNGTENYLFHPLRESKYEHLDPSAPNNFLKNLGYKDVQRAHGWRRMLLTAGKDVFKADTEVIRRQLGHLPAGKVLQAYDGSLLLEERKEFLDKWSKELVNQGLEV